MYNRGKSIATVNSANDGLYWRVLRQLVAESACPRADANDILLTITHFDDLAAKSQRRAAYSGFKEFDEALKRLKAQDKLGLTLISGARFGEYQNNKGCLRHDENVVGLTAYILDYDAGKIPFAEACRRFAARNITFYAATSSSHLTGNNGHRYRFIFPLSEELSPDQFLVQAARANGILDGQLGKDSFTLTQSFFVGQARTVFDKHTGKTYKCKPLESYFHVGSRFIDQCSDLDAGAVYLREKQPYNGREGGEGPIGLTLDETRQCLALVPHWVDERDAWMRVGMAVKEEHGEEGFAIWDHWSRGSEKYDEVVNRRQWKSYGRRKSGRRVTIATILREITDRGHGSEVVGPILSRIERDAAYRDLIGGGDEDDEPAQNNNPLIRFRTADDCANAPLQPYVIKGMASVGNVIGMIAPKSTGKSVLAPYLGYMVAKGGDKNGRLPGTHVFEPKDCEPEGMRVNEGGVFYIAAEDPYGMEKRLQALKSTYGKADNFKLVDGKVNLHEGSTFLAALRKQIERDRPSLIIVDTLHRAFPRIKENESDAMGEAFDVLQSLTRFGAAVVYLHHPGKGNDPSGRGHSSLMDDAHVGLLLKKEKTSIVSVYSTKNKNDVDERLVASFKIKRFILGVDQDGDDVTAPVLDPHYDLNDLDDGEGEVEQRGHWTDDVKQVILSMSGLDKGVTQEAIRVAYEKRCSANIGKSAKQKRIREGVPILVRNGWLKKKSSRLFVDDSHAQSSVRSVREITFDRRREDALI